MNLSGILGLAVLVLVLFFALFMGGGYVIWGHFVNIPSVIFVGLAAPGLQLLSTGMNPMLRSLCALRVLVVEVRTETISSRDADILRGLARNGYIAGAMGTVIGFVQMLASISDPSQLGAGIAVALLTVFYALLFAECIARPAAQRIEFLLHTSGKSTA